MATETYMPYKHVEIGGQIVNDELPPGNEFILKVCAACLQAPAGSPLHSAGWSWDESELSVTIAGATTVAEAVAKIAMEIATTPSE